MSNVIKLGSHEHDNVVTVLSKALERAKAGQIQAVALVEYGKDEVTGPGMTRISHCADDVRDATGFLAMVGGLEYMKGLCIEALET